MGEHEVVGVVVAQDSDCAVALVREINRPPLRHSLAGYGSAVAELGEIRIPKPVPMRINIEQFIDKHAYAFVNRSAVSEILVVACAVGDIEIISA